MTRWDIRINRRRERIPVRCGSRGNLNDIEVHKRLAQRIAHPRRRSRKQTVEALAIGFIAGQEHQQIATCVATAGKAGKELSDLPKFWN
jgi:hypothetical protein